MKVIARWASAHWVCVGMGLGSCCHKLALCGCCSQCWARIGNGLEGLVGAHRAFDGFLHWARALAFSGALQLAGMAWRMDER
ncbi:hypothetical protein ACFXTN_029467 [Malus domestica]